MAVAANDTGGNVIVSTTEDGGSSWTSTMMKRSLDHLTEFSPANRTTAQDPSVAFDSKGRLSVVYVLSNPNDASNAVVIAESTDGVHFNPPFAISFHGAGEKVIDSRPVVAIGLGGRYVAWENFGSSINVVRSEEGGIFGPPVTVVSGAKVGSPAITIGGSSVYIGWDEWGFNSHPPYHTGGRLMMASSHHGTDLRFSAPQQIATTHIGFSSLRIPMLPAPQGVSTNLNLAVDRTGEKVLYASFVDRHDASLSILFARSLDGGTTWSLTQLNNYAGGGDQFSPALNLDSQGNIYITFYDTLTKGGDRAQVFLARSSEEHSHLVLHDGSKDRPQGPTNSFTFQQITTVPIDESAKNLGGAIATNLGDRTAIAISLPNILIAWTDTRQKTEDIYVSILSVLP
jgi:hypothetical protein